MKKRFNPLTLLLPRVELLDCFFDVAMVGLDYYLQYYKKTPKIESLNGDFISSLDSMLLVFYGDARYFANGNIIVAASFEQNGLQLINKLKFISRIIRRQPLEEDIIEYFQEACSSIQTNIEQLIRSVNKYLSLPTHLQDDYIEILQYQSEKSYDFISSLKMFSPDTNAFLDDNGDFDRFIVDYRPQLPQGWKDVSSSSEGRFEKEFLLPAYFAQAYFEIPFNIRLCLKKKKDTNNQEGNCGYYAPLNEININIFLFPSNDFSIGKIRFPPEEIYGIILHEGVHLLQALMGQGSRNFEFTGLPYPRRTEFRAYEKEAEKALKLEFATNGLNPDIVNFYHLDDVEFYALLLDCIVDFIKTYIKDPISKNKADPCHIDFESHIDSYIDSDPFFESLKHLQIDKYTLAVEQFKEALYDHRESLETMYVCKVRKSKYLRK